MLEVYSINQAFTNAAAIPLNNTSLNKGCTAVLASPTTIELNRCGVYMVSCDASVTAGTAGLGTIQMSKNGILQPQAQSSETLVVGSASALSFVTLVQVSENNTCSCCSSPTLLRFLYTGGAATGNINVCVTKIC